MFHGQTVVKTRVRYLFQSILFLLWWSTISAGYSWPRHTQPWMQDNNHSQQPVFEVFPSSRFTAIVGQTIILPCVVHNLGDKMVSWIRTRDLHILTSGTLTFTADNRFEVIHSPDSDSWSLRIKRTRLSDTGKYECQVNTDPKMNNALLLTVTDAHLHDSPMDDADNTLSAGSVAVIRGPKEQYVRTGTTITFTCVVSRVQQRYTSTSYATTPSHRTSVKWMHAGRDITFQFGRGGISVDTDYRDKEITSRLTVALVRSEDAGSYTCGNTDVRPDTVTLVVVEGEHSEAMMRDQATGTATLRQVAYLAPLILHLLRLVM